MGLSCRIRKGPTCPVEAESIKLWHGSTTGLVISLLYRCLVGKLQKPLFFVFGIRNQSVGIGVSTLPNELPSLTHATSEVALLHSQKIQDFVIFYKPMISPNCVKYSLRLSSVVSKLNPPMKSFLCCSGSVISSPFWKSDRVQSINEMEVLSSSGGKPSNFHATTFAHGSSFPSAPQIGLYQYHQSYRNHEGPCVVK